MNEYNRSQTHSRRGALVGAVVVLMMFGCVAAYVLSIGPAAMLVSNDFISRDAVAIFYYPLIWLHDETFLRAPLEWYVGLWE